MGLEIEELSARNDQREGAQWNQSLLVVKVAGKGVGEGQGWDMG